MIEIIAYTFGIFLFLPLILGEALLLLSLPFAAIGLIIEACETKPAVPDDDD